MAMTREIPKKTKTWFRSAEINAKNFVILSPTRSTFSSSHFVV
jgi:hypothetical protein